MNQAALIEVLADCATATRDYLREAEKTSTMLAQCGHHPLTLEERLALFSQEILERDAFRIYLESKRFLHSVALRGYDAFSTT